MNSRLDAAFGMLCEVTALVLMLGALLHADAGQVDRAAYSIAMATFLLVLDLRLRQK